MTSLTRHLESKQGISTSGSSPPVQWNAMMEFTQSLLHLPKIRLDDVQRLADIFSLTTRSKLDKGYKFFIEQYLFDYEGKHFCIVYPGLR